MARAKTSSKARGAPGSSPRARLEVDERRAQLVALGIKVFTRSAYDEVSIADVAREAGISKGLLYHYFATKRDFYAATVREAAADLLLTTEVDPNGSPLERLEQGLSAYLDYVVRHGPAYAALLRSGIGADPEIARIVDDTRGAFLARLLEGIDPETRSRPLVRAALRGFIGFVEAMSLELGVHRSLDREALKSLAIGVLVTALERAGRA